MKYIIIPYTPLGLVLCLAIGIEYSCDGHEMFPTFYGSPFVFKQKSLGSSMEYFYSISGLILNVILWSLVLFFIDKSIQKLIKKIGERKLVNLFLSNNYRVYNSFYHFEYSNGFSYDRTWIW